MFLILFPVDHPVSWSGPHGLSLTPPLSSPDNSARWTACLSSPPPAPTNTKRGGNWDRQGHPACLLSSSWAQRSVGRGAAVLPTTASQFATQCSVERDAPPLLRLGLLNAYLTPASSARAKFQAGDRRLPGPCNQDGCLLTTDQQLPLPLPFVPQ